MKTTMNLILGSVLIISLFVSACSDTEGQLMTTEKMTAPRKCLNA